jgi:hypothetical protein
VVFTSSRHAWFQNLIGYNSVREGDRSFREKQKKRKEVKRRNQPFFKKKKKSKCLVGDRKSINNMDSLTSAAAVCLFSSR